MTTEDDWNAFAMELWGLSVATWTPIPERAGKLPEPLEYDTLHDGLVELEAGQRHMVIQCLSCYQVTDETRYTPIMNNFMRAFARYRSMSWAKQFRNVLVKASPKLLSYRRPGKCRQKMCFKYCASSHHTARHSAHFFQKRTATQKAKLKILH